MTDILSRIDDAGTRRYSDYMRARLAAYLIAFDGRVRLKDLRTFLRQHGAEIGRDDRSIRREDGKSNGSWLGRKLNDWLKLLVDEGLVRREGADLVVVDDLADLAAWLADEIDDDYAPPPKLPLPTTCTG